MVLRDTDKRFLVLLRPEHCPLFCCLGCMESYLNDASSQVKRSELRIGAGSGDAYVKSKAAIGCSADHTLAVPSTPSKLVELCTMIA